MSRDNITGCEVTSHFLSIAKINIDYTTKKVVLVSVITANIVCKFITSILTHDVDILVYKKSNLINVSKYLSVLVK